MDVTFIGRTADAEFAVMTGLLPDLRPRLMGLGVRTQSPNYLGHILQEKGYRTASYHGYKRSFWDRSYNHPVYGFQEMHFEEVYPPTESLGLGLPDGVVFDYFVEKLATEPDNRSFSMVITLSSHHPYVYVPKEYNKYFDRLAPDDGWGLAAFYLRSARYADVALGKLLEDMEKKGLMEDTLFVIYGDHDMGSLGAQFQLPEVGYDLFTRMADRVPFIIAVPGEEEFIAQHGEQHTTATGGLHDVMPTILHLIGEETPRGVMGTNLLIPDEFREAVPLPIQSDGRTYAYRHHLAFENSRRIEPIDAGSIRLDAGPSFDRIFLDQVVSRLLSHNPDIIPETEPERLAAPAPRDGNAELARRSP
jgi:phosphoglycerol transferase MdoB-like AlkP superfamily enzyme